MAGERIQKPTTEREQEVSEDTVRAVGEAAITEKGESLKGELDDLLDEIDEVLESNAEDFVKSYVQKGGQ